MQVSQRAALNADGMGPAYVQLTATPLFARVGRSSYGGGPQLARVGTLPRLFAIPARLSSVINAAFRRCRGVNPVTERDAQRTRVCSAGPAAGATGCRIGPRRRRYRLCAEFWRLPCRPQIGRA